ncbi:hypothetical protein Trydic_g15344, partial [Trypoxylus dichotomus]
TKNMSEKGLTCSENEDNPPESQDENNQDEDHHDETDQDETNRDGDENTENIRKKRSAYDSPIDLDANGDPIYVD